MSMKQKVFDISLFFHDETLYFDFSYCEEPIYERDIIFTPGNQFSGTTWENGIVPYEFDRNLSTKLRDSVKSAMENIESKSSVKFVRRTNQRDYIKITDCKDYFSFVGSAMHELMHALGFYHEHSRPDRDHYLTVNNLNCNYVKHEDHPNVTCNGPYDLESIMHYPLERGIKLNELNPGIMKLVSEKKITVGQREKLSKGDINALNELYPSTSSFRFLSFWT
ncbi:zincin [Rhizophagus irregularis]|uniref:Metalloendopeptidase n=1 Tax=Rhizophagus irregularis TaxID=588596 RepID=A0A2I1EFJ3_9GLOM|nr:zincin [Rhizophagus irregularis]PKC65959.1 zincin [Rhizophagus irregularis]PKY20908.1 zincin [Rhizophagus irregularis]